jgi:hypothetical protein
MSSRHTPHITTQRGLISELTRTLQIAGQSRGAASSSLMLCWADFTIATRGYSFRKGQLHLRPFAAFCYKADNYFYALSAINSCQEKLNRAG